MKRQSIWLKVFSAWTFFVWIVLIKNMIANADDRDLAFRLVHIGLAAVSLVLAGGAFMVSRDIDKKKL